MPQYAPCSVVQGTVQTSAGQGRPQLTTKSTCASAASGAGCRPVSSVLSGKDCTTTRLKCSKLQGTWSSAWSAPWLPILFLASATMSWQEPW